MEAQPPEEVKTGINEGSSSFLVDDADLMRSSTFEIEIPINKGESKEEAKKRRKSDSNMKLLYRTILDI